MSERVTKRGDATLIHTIMTLLIAALCIYVIFLVLSGQFEVLFGSSRVEDAARAGFQSFVIELNDFTNSPGDHAMRRNLFLTQAGTSAFPVLFFQRTIQSSDENMRADAKEPVYRSDYVTLYNYDGREGANLKKPAECGMDECLCLYSSESIDPGGSIRVFKELQCSSATASLVLTNVPKTVGSLIPEMDVPHYRTADAREDSILKHFFAEQVKDPLTISVDSFNIDTAPRTFTSLGIIRPIPQGTAKSLQDMYYAEKHVINGKIVVYLIPEQEYTEARASVFAEEFGEPVETLNSLVRRASTEKEYYDKITTYATKKLPLLLEAVTSKSGVEKKDAVGVLVSFSKEFILFLERTNSVLLMMTSGQGQKRTGDLYTELVLQLLEVIPEEESTIHSTNDYLLSVVKNNHYVWTTEPQGGLLTNPSVSVEEAKQKVFSGILGASKKVTPASFTLLKTTIEKNELWSESSREKRYNTPELKKYYSSIREKYPLPDMTLLKNHLESMTVENSLQQQQVAFLLGKLYSSYDLAIDGVTKRWNDKAIVSFKSAIASNPDSDIGSDARREMNVLCESSILSPEEVALCNE